MDARVFRTRAAALLIALCVAYPLRAADVTLEIMLFDPKGLLGGQRDELLHEVERILGSAGIEVLWLPTNEILEMQRNRLPLRATLVEKEADYLRLTKKAMGVTAGEGGATSFSSTPPSFARSRRTRAPHARQSSRRSCVPGPSAACSSTSSCTSYALTNPTPSPAS